MQIKMVETLVAQGAFANSLEWQVIHGNIRTAIQKVDWPVGSGKFCIYPESGKKTGQGNGVKPIKRGLIEDLKAQGWTVESPFSTTGQRGIRGNTPGGFDAALATPYGQVVLEWETGNVSSSHRAINKMGLWGFV